MAGSSKKEAKKVMKRATKTTQASSAAVQSRKNKSLAEIWAEWTPAERKILEKLDTPEKIQLFVDNKLKYDGPDGCRSVRHTLATKEAHCLGGCMLAYYLLTRLGYDAFCIGLDAVNDDAHAICVYSRTVAIKSKSSKGSKTVNKKFFGSLSKSNFTLIRSRDCVYSSLRELLMSYWDFYFNTAGDKTLAAYSAPFAAFKHFKGTAKEDRYSWLFNPVGKDAAHCERCWNEMPNTSLLPPSFDTRKQGRKQDAKSAFGKSVFKAPKILVDGGTLDANRDNIYQC